MYRILDRGMIFVGLTTLLAGLAGSQSLSAQTEGEGGASMMGTEQHAQIGTLEAVGYDNQRVVLRLPDNGDRPAYESYATDGSTPVGGLGEVMQLEDLTPEALDRIVVVTFKEGDQRLRATSLTFPLATRIRVTYGTIENIDRQNEILALKDASGAEHRFNLDMGYGVKIDSGRGLLDASDLRAGQDVRVYYAGPHAIPGRKDMPDDAYLIFVRS